MSVRNLDQLFDPRSVAVVGASNRPNSVGGQVWRNIRDGFTGAFMAVNPKLTELDGLPVHARIGELPQVPELVVIATPPATVPGLIDEAGRMGAKAAVVVTAGLDAATKLDMLRAARPHLLRVLGPNCIGLLNPHIGLNASFAHTAARPGELAFVSQSGALVTAVLDWANGQAIGFSQIASVGESADVDFGDMLDYLASDPRTHAVLMYIESIDQPRKFMSAARAAARNKPVVVVKSGRSEQGQRAAASHTGALAGSDMVYDAAFARAGMLRVDTLQQLFLAAEVVSRFRTSTDERLTILTNGGGAGVMAADAAARFGVRLAELSEETLARLDGVLPANWSHGNPVDIIGDAPGQRYVDALEALMADRGAGALLMVHAPTAIVPSAEISRALVPVVGRHRHRVMSAWLGDAAVREAEETFREARIATYPTPEMAVQAFGMLLTYRRNQVQLTQTPAALAPPEASPPDLMMLRAGLTEVLRQGRELLTEPEAKRLLAAYGIPVVATVECPADAEAAARVAGEVGFPAVLKILSRDITHKSDVGGVALGLADAMQVHETAERMLQRVRRVRPDARIDGFTVQAMAPHTHARELIVGASVDSVFGPTILFGQGGTAVEVVADRAVGLPPLNEVLARSLVDRTRVARLLAGFRDTPPADRDAVHRVLMAVSQMLADLPELCELDINPLIASPDGAVALDARVRVSATRPAGQAEFAIRPYPAEQVERITWDGRGVTLRPIRPEDEPQHRSFLERMDPEDVRLRVFYSRRTIPHSQLARLTQVDYEREIAIVAVAPGPDGQEETLGVVRAAIDPDNTDAEFGISVRSDLKGKGLGEVLLQKIIHLLRGRGTTHISALVLAENTRMLTLARGLGFAVGPGEDHETVRLGLDLLPSAPAGPGGHQDGALPHAQAAGAALAAHPAPGATVPDDPLPPA